MRTKINTFLSSGPWGAIVSAFTAPILALVKPALINALAGALGTQPEQMSGVTIPLGAIPLYLGAAMFFGYLGGLLGGLLKRRLVGIVLGGLLGGLLTNVFFTLR